MLEMTLSHQLQAAPENRAAECDPGVKYPSSWDALCFPHAVRKGHATFAMLGWVPIFKIFLGLRRNLPLAPSVIGRHINTSLFLLPCSQIVPILSTKKGTLTHSLLALVFSRFQCI